MTSHRTLSDAAFQTYIAGLSQSSLVDRIAAINTLKTQVQTEAHLLKTEDTQIRKHTFKVDKTHADLHTLKAFTFQNASIADGELTIAKTSGLQTSLDGKQATLVDDSVTQYMVQNLPISKITGLQTALDSTPAAPETFNQVVDNFDTPTAQIKTGRIFRAYDTGGANYSYSVNENLNRIYQTSGGSNWKIKFIAFASEANYDYFSIVEIDENDVETALLTNHSGSGLPSPAEITSTQSTVKFIFTSDHSNIEFGFDILLYEDNAGQNTLVTNTDSTYSLSVVNGASGTTSTSPGAPPHLSTIDKYINSVSELNSHVFQIGMNTRGFFRIYASSVIPHSSWFDICIDSDLLTGANTLGYFFDDIITVPVGNSYTLINQQRSFNADGQINKRMYIEYTDCPVGEFCTVFFKIHQ